ncbi:MAG: hypothetical protein ACLRT5_02355 [Lachnospiraceae bacterium]
MRGIWKLLKSEAIRLKHTPLLWVHLIVPLLGAAVFLGYYSFSGWGSAAKEYRHTCRWFPAPGRFCAVLSAHWQRKWKPRAAGRIS